jgi:uncharacterized coiled-coil protein SlyX
MVFVVSQPPNTDKGHAASSSTRIAFKVVSQSSCQKKRVISLLYLSVLPHQWNTSHTAGWYFVKFHILYFHVNWSTHPKFCKMAQNDIHFTQRLTYIEDNTALWLVFISEINCVLSEVRSEAEQAAAHLKMTIKQNQLWISPAHEIRYLSFQIWASVSHSFPQLLGLQICAWTINDIAYHKL